VRKIRFSILLPRGRGGVPLRLVQELRGKEGGGTLTGSLFPKVLTWPAEMRGGNRKSWSKPGGGKRLSLQMREEKARNFHDEGEGFPALPEQDFPPGTGPGKKERTLSERKGGPYSFRGIPSA